MMSNQEKKDSNGIALLLIDVQNDFIDGSLAVKDATSILPNVHSLLSLQHWQMIVASQDSHPPGHISFASTHNLPPFQTIQIPHPTLKDKGEKVEQMLWPDHCLKGSRGYELEESVKKSLESRREKGMKVEVIEKGQSKNHDAYSAFSYNHYLSFSALPRMLFSHKHSIQTLVLCGLATDYCLLSSAVDSIKFGFRTIVVLEGCRGVDDRGDSCQLEIDLMRNWGVEFLGVEEVMEMLGVET